MLFLLWLHLFILSGVISPLISTNILGTYQPAEFIFQCPNFLPFHTVHGVLMARILKWFAIPSPVDHILSELSIMTHLSWVALHGMAGLCSLWKTRKWILPCFLAFHIFWNSMGFFALQLHCSSLCLHYYVVFFVSVYPTSRSFRFQDGWGYYA